MNQIDFDKNSTPCRGSQNRLKDALPTTVWGPRLPAKKRWLHNLGVTHWKRFRGGFLGRIFFSAKKKMASKKLYKCQETPRLTIKFRVRKSLHGYKKSGSRPAQKKSNIETSKMETKTQRQNSTAPSLKPQHQWLWELNVNCEHKWLRPKRLSSLP